MGREMSYSELVDVYERLSLTTKRLEKEKILADFFRHLSKKGESEWVYLLKGRVFADYDERIIGMSQQLTIKAMSKAFGVSAEDIAKRYRKIGDLGEIAAEFAGHKKQRTLFSSKLDVHKVFDNFRKVAEIEGKGAVGKKVDLIAELLGSASDKEAKYIVRTVLEDLRVGVADGVLRDSLAEAFFAEEKKEMAVKIEEVLDLCNDFSLVFDSAIKGKHELEKVNIIPGKPVKVMLPVKVTALEEAFRICGKPAAIEHKYDGFRMVISKHEGKVKLFTRRLENVTDQFPDVVDVVKKNITGKEFIIDSEVVGYDPKTKRSKPFEAISQRIRRKYEIDKLIKELPVEINVFDVLFFDGASVMQKPFVERRKIIEKIVKSEKFKIRTSMQFVTDDEKKAEQFYKDALKQGEEGIMVKKLDAPYNAGRRVGYMVKLKPAENDFDLVIVGAEYGSGKRAGWLTSYILGCRSGNDFLEIGKVSSGLKEKEEQGTSYVEMTRLLKPLIEKTDGKTVKIKPKLVVAVTYQNIQRSPSYSSGFALRFPRITAYRPDRSTKDIASLQEIVHEVERIQRGINRLG